MPKASKKQVCDELKREARARALEAAQMTRAANELERQGLKERATSLRDKARYNEVERIKLLAQASALGC